MQVDRKKVSEESDYYPHFKGLFETQDKKADQAMELLIGGTTGATTDSEQTCYRHR